MMWVTMTKSSGEKSTFQIHDESSLTVDQNWSPITHMVFSKNHPKVNREEFIKALETMPDEKFEDVRRFVRHRYSELAK